MMMGRESRDSAGMGSSIALLQERFRQLERAREQREVKELKLFFEPREAENPVKSFEPSAAKPTICSKESGLDCDQLRLGLDLSSRNAEFQVVKKRPLWWGEKTRVSTTRKIETTSDVDTSLHL